MSLGLPFYLPIEITHAKNAAADCLWLWAFTSPSQIQMKIEEMIHWPLDKLFLKAHLWGLSEMMVFLYAPFIRDRH